MNKLLGVIWKNDFFFADIPVKDFKKTRRSISSSLASVFDPLGMAASLILCGNRINQEFCRLLTGLDTGYKQVHRALSWSLGMSE